MIQNSFKQIFKRTWLLVLALLVGFVLVGCDPVEEDLNIDLTFVYTMYIVFWLEIHFFARVHPCQISPGK